MASAPTAVGSPLYVDSSALLRRYVRAPGSALVLDTMRRHPDWCASTLCRTETQLALRRASAYAEQQRRLWSALQADWDAFWVVPLDGRALARATELGAAFGLRTIDALHLASADRLPRPAAYLTFDRRQIPAAAALGLEVVSPVED